MEKLINDFSVGLFFWQTLLFVVLVLFLRKYAWKPILNAVEEREEGIKNALDSAEKAKNEMKNLNADNERILAEARMKSNELIPAVTESLALMGHELEGQIKRGIERNLEEVKKAMLGNSSKDLKDANEALDESTEPLAVLLIEKALEE